MSDGKDQIYRTPLSHVEAFRFDAAVADVFQDMIERSVPGYGLILQLIGSLAERYVRPETNVYDLGCSLGASTLQLRRHSSATTRIIGIDNSEAMINRCRANLDRDHSAAPYEIRLQDLRETPIENASMVVLNFTLQFVPDAERQTILTRIAEGLLPGGVLLLAEKIRFDEPDRQALLTELHHEFKKHQGYSDLEIAQKRAALENVLTPNTEPELLQRLDIAGFSNSEVCVRCLNFEAILAIR